VTDTEFGELLNTVNHLPTPCPRGHQQERMYVYERAVRWSCGKVELLPPIAVQGRKPRTT
jgi:hypothetical protein